VTALTAKQYVEMNPPFAGALQEMQAAARLGTCAQGLRPCIFF
jgi:hypothetical protein